jgi:hypothetical protein
MIQRDEIPPGTLHMLILRTLARSGELHGFEIASSRLVGTSSRWKKAPSIRPCSGC